MERLGLGPGKLVAMPSTGLQDVDLLIVTAIHQGLVFPDDVTHWQLLAWAAEALEMRRQQPEAWARDGLEIVTNRHFPQLVRPGRSGALRPPGQ